MKNDNIIEFSGVTKSGYEFSIRTKSGLDTPAAVKFIDEMQEIIYNSFSERKGCVLRLGETVINVAEFVSATLVII